MESPSYGVGSLDSFSVNQASNNPLIQLLKEMQDMRVTISNLTLVNQQQSQQIGEINTQINPRTGQSWKWYWLPCGCTTHWSKTCSRKKKGHQNDATFKNRMGGSNLNCKWHERGTEVHNGLGRAFNSINVNYIYICDKPLSSVVSSINSDIMKADTGASRTYLKSDHEKFLINKNKLNNGPKATLPNNDTIQASLQGYSISIQN